MFSVLEQMLSRYPKCTFRRLHFTQSSLKLTSNFSPSNKSFPKWQQFHHNAVLQTHILFPLQHAPSCQLLITLPSSVPNRVPVYSLCLPEGRASAVWGFSKQHIFRFSRNNKKCVAPYRTPLHPTVSSLSPSLPRPLNVLTTAACTGKNLYH